MTTGDQQPTTNQAAARAILLVAALTNPDTALLAVIMVVTCRTLIRRRLHPLWILSAGTVALTIGLLLHWPTTYLAPWVELGHRIIATHDIQAVGALIGARWPTWLMNRLPMATTLATSTAGAYLTWRRRYDATWRTPSHHRPASPHRVAHAKRQLDTQARTTPPAATITRLTIPLGIDAYTAAPVHLRATDLRMHGLVIGPTGAGKTQALQRLIWGLCAQPAARNLHAPAVIIDMKADPALTAWLADLAATTGRAYHQITTSPDTSNTTYNPLAGRDGDQIADAVYEATFAGDPTINTHYATLSRRLLQVASHTLCALTDAAALRPSTSRPWQPTLPDLVELLSLDTLRWAADDVDPTTRQRISRYLADVKASGTAGDLGDIRDRLAVTTDTTMGRILNTGGLDLHSAIRHGDIICFSLDAATTPELARTMGRLAINDLVATFSDLAATGWGATHLCPVILDEFSALGTPRVGDLFARARSAGGAIILATQDLDADLGAVDERFAAAVRTNANAWLILRQTRAEMADSIAADIGTRTGWKETVQITDDWDPLGGMHAASGVGSLREVEEFVLHPNEIKSLPIGAAYLVIKTPTGSVETTIAPTTITRLHIAQAPPTTPAHAQQPTTPEDTITSITIIDNAQDDDLPAPRHTVPPPPDDAW